MAGMRRYRRVLLLVVLPLVALVGGLTFYLNGGRYVTTDDAYVGAQKVLITPDVSGKIDQVVEGRPAGQRPATCCSRSIRCRFARAGAGRAKLDDAKTTTTIWSPTSSSTQTSDLANAGIDSSSATSTASLRWSRAISARSSTSTIRRPRWSPRRPSSQLLKQRSNALKNQLLGNPDLPLEQFPAYAGQGRARRGPAQPRSHRARADGRHRDAGRSDSARPLRHGRHAGVQHHRHLEALGRRQSEGIRLHLCRGRPARHARRRCLPRSRLQGHGRLALPGTGAQFAILPPQNATGNFVKVVQRVPVRIYFDKNDKYVRKLKAGMSVYATIDTNHRRSLAALLGFSPAVAANETRLPCRRRGAHPPFPACAGTW
jgi:membrane fusion protein (multidrug efflux system)